MDKNGIVPKAAAKTVMKALRNLNNRDKLRLAQCIFCDKLGNCKKDERNEDERGLCKEGPRIARCLE